MRIILLSFLQNLIMILRMGIRRKVSFVNERPSRFRILIRHQLGRRCHRFSESTRIQEEAEAGSSGGNKPVPISSWAAFAMRRCQGFIGRLWISRHHLFKFHFKWVLFFRFSILSVSFMSNAILSTTLWISIMKKNTPLAKMSAGIHGAFSNLELLKVNYLLLHKLLSQFLQKTYPGSRSCVLSIIFINQLEEGY